MKVEQNFFDAAVGRRMSLTPSGVQIAFPELLTFCGCCRDDRHAGPASASRPELPGLPAFLIFCHMHEGGRYDA